MPSNAIENYGQKSQLEKREQHKLEAAHVTSLWLTTRLRSGARGTIL